MPVSTEITLPKKHEPTFPHQCIVCHATPDSKIKVAQNAQNPFLVFIFPLVMIFGWVKISVPICSGCKSRFRLQRWGRELICLAIAITAVFLLKDYIANYTGFMQKLVFLGVVVMALLPYLIAEVVWPRFFEATARRDSIDYEFASESYASIFYTLNQDQVIKSDFDDE